MVLLRQFLSRLRVENARSEVSDATATSNTSVRVCIPLLTVFW